MVSAGREFLDPAKILIATGMADSFALRSSFFYFPLSQGEELVLYKGKITVLSGNIGRY
jgi:hypothetical protein